MTATTTAAASIGPSRQDLGHFAIGGFTEPGSQRWLEGIDNAAETAVALGLMMIEADVEMKRPR